MPIRELELTAEEDRAFFRLFYFTNHSFFNQSPLARQITLIASLEPHKCLRYAQDPKFYKIAKSEPLKTHWEKILRPSTYEGHPFDELLRRLCEEKRELAKEENNPPLARAYAELEAKYAKAGRAEILNEISYLR